MIKNYFKIAWRNLWKNKVFSTINVIGLAIGMAACIVIMLFVLYERSFDNFHSKNIYRLNEVQKFEGMVASQKVALSMFPMGPTLKNEFPEIKNYTRVHWTGKFQMTYGEKRLYFSETLFVDSTFLDMFDFKLIKGDRKTVLKEPKSAVLTESVAEKLFGKQDPLGKTITHYGGDTSNFIVTGILKDVPQNSQMQFDALFSFNTIYQPDWMNNWGGNWLNTYVELAGKTNVPALEKKFPAYLKKYMAAGDNWKNYELFLLPIRSVHAGASDIGLDYINYQKFNKNYTNIFSIIAIIVLIIACVNFMNLSTARSAERAKEVGIRKSVGARRFQLSLQFIGETVLLSLVALLLAFILVQLVLPYINNLSQRNLRLPFLNKPLLLLYVILGTVAVGVLSGIYPALYLSSFKPVKVLKGSVQIGKNKGLLRNALVIAQFTSAIFLIIATIFAVRQLSYMQSRDPGFVRDQIVTIPLDRITGRKYDVVKQELTANTIIAGVTAAQDQLGSHLDQSGIEFKGDGPVRELTSTRLIVDPDYLHLYKIPILLGRNFSNDSSANGKEYIINEALAKELLKDNRKQTYSYLLGKRFGFDSLGTIVGIAKDFNFNSLHYKIETMFMHNQKNWGYSNMSVKINGGKVKEALAYIQGIWKKNFADHPFEYQFLDDHFKEVYKADTQVNNIVGILAALAIIISCLGLFGLASYSAEKRIKEVGIRKVLGASVQNIVALLSKHFLKLVLIANLIAWPIAWFALNRWLQDYAYRVNISWWVFAIAGVTAILIALITVSFQAIKSAIANPVKSLRTE
ncbi:MAG TPA: ABC transporter permease [Chitinophagaceae bacterium]|jgi:putative ABC transport system permease protein|nr:ABC transporter permease [Chitinophagaceae bacterium]